MSWWNRRRRDDEMLSPLDGVRMAPGDAVWIQQTPELWAAGVVVRRGWAPMPTPLVFVDIGDGQEHTAPVQAVRHRSDNVPLGTLRHLQPNEPPS